MLYTLICYSFNNQIRFNSKGDYNMPFGKERSSFNPTLRDKFEKFVDGLHKKDFKFVNLDFRKIQNLKFKDSDFLYCDPPIIILLLHIMKTMVGMKQTKMIY